MGEVEVEEWERLVPPAVLLERLVVCGWRARPGPDEEERAWLVEALRLARLIREWREGEASHSDRVDQA